MSISGIRPGVTFGAQSSGAGRRVQGGQVSFAGKRNHQADATNAGWSLTRVIGWGIPAALMLTLGVEGCNRLQETSKKVGDALSAPAEPGKDKAKK